MSRWTASAWHLAVTAIVIAAIGIGLLSWYPPELFQVAGADRLLLILAGVSMASGPLLTLLVYREGKRGMRFDLIVIVLLQIGLLGYGIYSTWASRPVFLVAAVDRLEMVYANQVRPEDLSVAPSRYRTLGQRRPRLVGLVLPTDPEQKEAVLFEEIAGHPATPRPDLYGDYTIAAKSLLARARSVDTLLARGGQDRTRVQAALRDVQVPASKVRWVPLDAGRGTAVQLISAIDGRPLAVVAVDPWPENPLTH
jgi:hypothetical protein